jgi:hypothetical protein
VSGRIALHVLWGAVAGAALGVAARVVAGATGTASLRIGATASSAIAVGVLLVALGEGSVSDFDRAVSASHPPAPERSTSLERLERAVRISFATAGDVHFRLRPLLRDLAVERLATHRRVDLDREPDRAARLLGEELFELVRADRPRPPDQFAPGLSVRVVLGFVERLESL